MHVVALHRRPNDRRFVKRSMRCAQLSLRTEHGSTGGKQREKGLALTVTLADEDVHVGVVRAFGFDVQSHRHRPGQFDVSVELDVESGRTVFDIDIHVIVESGFAAEPLGGSIEE